MATTDDDAHEYRPGLVEMMERRAARPEAPAIWDSRTDEPVWSITTQVDGEVTEWRKPMADPLVHHRVTTSWPWWNFWKRQTETVIMIDVRSDVAEAVLELDGNYRGEMGSRRRGACDARFKESLQHFADDPTAFGA